MAEKKVAEANGLSKLITACHKAASTVPGVAMATDPQFVGSRLPKGVFTVIGADGTIYRVTAQRISSIG